MVVYMVILIYIRKNFKVMIIDIPVEAVVVGALNANGLEDTVFPVVPLNKDGADVVEVAPKPPNPPAVEVFVPVPKAPKPVLDPNPVDGVDVVAPNPNNDCCVVVVLPNAAILKKLMSD